MAGTATIAIDPEALQGFVAGVRGPVLQPGDDRYDDARAIWNGLIDRRPALIVQCTGAADVDAVALPVSTVFVSIRAAATTS